MRFRDADGWILFDYDPKMGRQVWYRENPDGTTTFRTDYEISATLDANKAMQNSVGGGWSGDWHKIASIPYGVLNRDDNGVLAAIQQDDQNYLSRWLNNADNRAFRTKLGSV